MTPRKLQPPPGKPEPEIFEPGAPLTEASMLHTLQQIRANAAREHERLRLAAIELDKNFERKAEARQRSYEKDIEEAQRLYDHELTDIKKAAAEQARLIERIDCALALDTERLAPALTERKPE